MRNLNSYSTADCGNLCITGATFWQKQLLLNSVHMEPLALQSHCCFSSTCFSLITRHCSGVRNVCFLEMFGSCRSATFTQVEEFINMDVCEVIRCALRKRRRYDLWKQMCGRLPRWDLRNITLIKMAKSIQKRLWILVLRHTIYEYMKQYETIQMRLCSLLLWIYSMHLMFYLN